MSEMDEIRQQVEQAAGQFAQRFGRQPRYAAVAPGRVNLIGEHTDYNGGFVLPMAIERRTVIVADRSTGDGAAVVRVASAEAGEEPASFPVSAEVQPGEPRWANYVKGVVVNCLRQGLNPGGFDALVASTVPLGGGLSSSAALEVATATLLEAMTGKALPPVEKALLCQKAEHEFPKMPCGIMDQFISVMGQAGHALLLDCRSMETRQVPLRDPGVSVLIANTNVKHELEGSPYADRRRQCEAGAKALGVAVLRDASLVQLEAAKAKLGEVEYRRAHHVIGEIARTTRAAEAMTAGDWPAVGQLMYESHESLQKDYEVSCAELDLLVDLAQELGPTRGVIGSRMTGGGFGGCTVSLVRTEQLEAVMKYLGEEYKKRTKIEATLFATRPASGAQVVQI